MESNQPVYSFKVNEHSVKNWEEEKEKFLN